jgi:type IV secretory pathway TrbD component
MPFRPTRPGALWMSCHADDAESRRHVSTETEELVQVVFFTTIAWTVAVFGMNLVAVGILVFVAASAGKTIANVNTSGSERRSLFTVREPFSCAQP